MKNPGQSGEANHEQGLHHDGNGPRPDVAWVAAAEQGPAQNQGALEAAQAEVTKAVHRIEGVIPEHRAQQDDGGGDQGHARERREILSLSGGEKMLAVGKTPHRIKRRVFGRMAGVRSLCMVMPRRMLFKPVFG